MDAFGIALSGLGAASAGLAAQASNLANQRTEGYRARRVDLAAQAGGGVEVRGLSEDPAPVEPGASNVDPATEIVQGMGFELMYKANLKVIKSQAELFQATLDLKA